MLLVTFVIVFLVLFQLVIISNTLIGRSIKRPIEELITFTKTFVASDDLTLRSNIKSKDEAQILSASIDNLIENLQENLAYTQNVIESMADMLIILDSKGIIMEANKATIFQLGFSEEELVGRSVNFILEGELKLVIEELIKNNEVRGIEGAYIAKDERKVPVLF